MSYLIIHFESAEATIKSFKELKEKVNKLLTNELVDEESIHWDEENDLYFNIPKHKPFKEYWFSLLNRFIANSEWKILPKS